MEIYKLTPADWKGYRDLRREALLENPEAFSETYENALQRTDAEWEEKMKTTTSHIFVVRDGEEYVGMAGGFQEKGEKISHAGYVWGVYLRKTYRGQGLGKQMMQALLSELQKNPEIKKIKLGVNTMQAAAVKMYESFGFKIVGTLQMEMRIGDTYFDEYVMEKII